MIRGIALVQPRYNDGVAHEGSCQAFHTVHEGLDRHGIGMIHRFKAVGSVLPQNFSGAWANALNFRQKENLAYFCMLHDDVVPLEPNWLAILLDELHRTGADVISAVVPLKNLRGLTSTALGGEDIWVNRRLTIKEVCALPETFDINDCRAVLPHDPEDMQRLLVNTGLFLCRFDQKWARRICFRFQNRIVFHVDPETGEETAEAECITEDWTVSNQLFSLGAKVVATTKVKLFHQYPHYNNYTPWGAWDTDKEHDERVLEQRAEPIEPEAEIAYE